MALPHLRDCALDRIGAIGGLEKQIGPSADIVMATVDHFWVRETDGGVESRRTKLLEVGRAANLDE